MEENTRSAFVAAGKVLGFLIAVLVAAQIAMIPVGAISAKYWSQYDGRGLNEPFFFSSAILSALVTLLVCYLFLKYIDKKNWAYIRFTAGSMWKLFLWGSGTGLLMVLLYTASVLLPDAVEINVEPGPAESIFFYLGFAVLAIFFLSLNEELIFRGYILKTLESRFRPLWAIIISSLLFSLLHLFNPNASFVGSVNIFLVGSLLALTCITYASLWQAVGLHFGWNFSLFLFDFPVSGLDFPNPLFDLQYHHYSLFTGSKFGPEDSLITTLLLGLLVWYFYIKFRKSVR